MPPTDTGGAQDSDEREEQRTEEDTAGSAYSVKVYAMTAEERSALDAQTEPAPVSYTHLRSVSIIATRMESV